jgi:Sulfotransferase family
LLPNLLIIGAAKCGTTSLHEYLSLHPQVFMSRRKELAFFTRENWRERRAWYEEQFQPALIRGESSPGYTMFPYRRSTAEDIHELMPEAKLIYLVRDPVERAIANYVEFVALRLEDRKLDEALTDVGDPANPYLAGSRYAVQLDRFLRLFPTDQLLLLEQVDLLRDRARTLDAVFAFLGVDPFDSPHFADEHNTRDVKVRYRRLGYWLVQRGLFTERGGPFSRGPLVQPLRALLSTPIDRVLSATARETLVRELKPDVDRLRELTGKPFDAWQAFR